VEYVSSFVVFWSLLSISLHGSIPPTPTVPLAKKETKSSWGGAAEKIKSGEERLLTLHRDPAFLRSKAFFPVFFGTRYDTDPLFCLFFLVPFF
jgi:hypothetical protein